MTRLPPSPFSPLRQRSRVGIGSVTAILPTSTTAALAARRAVAFLPARLPKRSQAQAGAATPQTKTWTHTTAGSNRVLVLTADIFQDVAGTGSITSATYGGTALTKVTAAVQGTKSCEVWYLKNPPSGANTLSVTVTGDTDAIKLGATSFTNVDQTAPLDVSNTAVGSTGNPAVSLTTTAANDVIVSTIDRHTTADATTSQTKIFKDNLASILGAASYQLTTTAGAYTDTYTGAASANWCMIAAGFKPVTTSGGSGSTTIRYLSTDILNGSNIVTDSSGSVVESLDAYPYGAPRVDAKAGTYGGEKRKYAGTEYDSTSGLNYMNARYQNGAQGQFISEDPIANMIANTSGGPAYILDANGGGTPYSQLSLLASPQMQNSYSYAISNPVTKSDPSGKQAAAVSLLAPAAPELAPFAAGTAVLGVVAFAGWETGQLIGRGIEGVINLAKSGQTPWNGDRQYRDPTSFMPEPSKGLDDFQLSGKNPKIPGLPPGSGKWLFRAVVGAGIVTAIDLLFQPGKTEPESENTSNENKPAQTTNSKPSTLAPAKNTPSTSIGQRQSGGSSKQKP